MNLVQLDFKRLGITFYKGDIMSVTKNKTYNFKLVGLDHSTPVNSNPDENRESFNDEIKQVYDRLGPKADINMLDIVTNVR